MNSPQANFARLTAIAVSAVWALALFFTGLDLDASTRRWLAYLPSVAGVLVVAFDLWLWKIPGMNKLTGKPRIDGTWSAVLTPNPKSDIPPEGNWQPTAAMVIEQTFWTIAVRLHTAESNSSSVNAVLKAAADSKQNHDLYFTYANRAQQAHSNRSPAHRGTTHLHIVGPRPKNIDGTYWTDRLTAGDITAKWVSEKTDLSPAEALRLATESQA